MRENVRTQPPNLSKVLQSIEDSISACSPEPALVQFCVGFHLFADLDRRKNLLQLIVARVVSVCGLMRGPDA